MAYWPSLTAIRATAAAICLLTVGVALPVAAQFITGDVNDDGVFDVLDSAVMRRDLAGFPPGMTQQCVLPICGNALCDAGETCVDCPEDCGACPPDPTALYVSTPANGGIDTPGCGALTSPCATIGFGLVEALNTARSRVNVSAGEYLEDVTLISGIDLIGGFDPSTWQPGGPPDASIIRGTSGSGHRSTVVASGIAVPTLFTGFTVYGAAATSPRSNSYGIYVSNSSDQLMIIGNAIFAGSGAPGAVAMAGLDGLPGVDGQGRVGDPTGYDAFITPTSPSPCSSINNRQFANGGSGSCQGDGVSGGHGGGNQCAPVRNTETSGSDGLSGQPGAGGRGGPGGPGGDAGDDGELRNLTCFLPPSPMTGLAGIDGISAQNGTGGSGCAAAGGSVSGGHWVASGGAGGSAGGNGGGGGGGGAGGGGENTTGDSSDRLGGHGGGGGSGGCGGQAGIGGEGGGGSFAVFVTGGTAPTITDNFLFLGSGGRGGAGGRGGVGGIGGQGGLGGQCPGTCLCYSDAGDGGSGGDGGHAGAGGGGCGGGAFGMYTFGVGSPDYCVGSANNLITGGVAGPGGSAGLSLAGPGGDGAAGAIADCSFN